jgi:hypothetical protein
MSGARWFDLIEIWHRDRIVAFGTMNEVRHRKAPTKTTEPADAD